MQRNAGNISSEISSNSNDSVRMHKLILKLRWIGLDEEADHLRARVAESDLSEYPIMEPRETD